MTDPWIDRLSEYLDDELEPSERAALEQHVTSCVACASALDELRGVVARAAALPPRPPASDLWAGIEPRLDPVKGVVTPFQPRVTRRVSFTLPQLVAAGLALMVMSAGGMWVLLNGGPVTDTPPISAASPTDLALVPAAAADPRYDEAITDLQQALEAGRAQLDAGTVRILEANLKAIDEAIEQSRKALAADPANVYLHSHLAEARQRKLALLRRGVGLINSKS
jgi:tetratricopeptide (TPR) repeat protein